MRSSRICSWKKTFLLEWTKNYFNYTDAKALELYNEHAGPIWGDTVAVARDIALRAGRTWEKSNKHKGASGKKLLKTKKIVKPSRAQNTGPTTGLQVGQSSSNPEIMTKNVTDAEEMDSTSSIINECMSAACLIYVCNG